MLSRRRCTGILETDNLMSNLRPPQLGPIVGHTTETSACIWIRGGDAGEGADIAGNRRTVGVVAITREGGRRPASRAVYYFRLRREYDRTGFIVLGKEVGLVPSRGRVPEARPLRSDTEYEVRVGTLTVDDPDPEGDSIDSEIFAERLPNARVWFDELEALDAESSTARFSTFPQSSEALSFLLGSCRYPGLLWKTKHSDRIFGPMFDEVRGRDGRGPVRFSLMVGDQIYADMLNRHVPIGRADTFEEFQERYHSAFGSRHMRRLLSHVPTYMILDDHEIEDNWSQDRIERTAHRRVFNYAIEAYRSYQWVHGPRSYGDRLFYRFECAGYPCFVLDTRTQRYMDDDPDSLEDNHLLGRPSLDPAEPSQLDVLLQWLRDCQERFGDRPKFIVTSSVFVPSPMNARTGRKADSEEQRVKRMQASDSWPAFPATRSSILSCIVERTVQNVVFLSGDIHCSNVSSMEISGSAAARKLRLFSVVSSALYWPFPFADGDPASFVHDSRQDRQNDEFRFDVGAKTYTMSYRAWNFTQEDNFCRIDVDRQRARLTVTAFDSDGEVIERGGWFGSSGEPVISELELAPW